MARSGLTAEKPARGPGPAARLRRMALALRNRVILGVHGIADRLDLVPPEFGREQPVDERNPDAVAAEWARYLRLWADYNPEEVFALKVGAALLIAAIVGLWLLIAIFF